MRAGWLALALATAACGTSPPPPDPPRPASGPLCSLVSVTIVPEVERAFGPGKWSVELPVGGPVAAAHRERFARAGVEPNGPAWTNLVVECSAPEHLPADVHLDPEAGAVHAWVETDASKDRFVAALCRAVEDGAWLDRCLGTVDRARLDD